MSLIPPDTAGHSVDNDMEHLARLLPDLIAAEGMCRDRSAAAIGALCRCLAVLLAEVIDGEAVPDTAPHLAAQHVLADGV